MNGKFFWLLMTAIFIVVGHLSYVLFVPGYKMGQKFDNGFVVNARPAFVTLSEKQTIELFPAEDPAVLHAVCPFDVSQGPIKISIAPFEHYWSLSIYSQKGDSYYSINDRQSIDSKLTIHVRASARVEDDEVKQREMVRDKTVLDAPTPKGWAVLRFQIHNGASRAAIAQQAKTFVCQRDES